MTFSPTHFYLGNHDEVRRWPFARGQRRLEGAGERITTLPGGGYHQHWTRNVLLAPDGEHLYVTIGSASNDDPEPEPRATVQVMRLDGSERRTFASGVRNPVGLAFHPRTGQLWATVVERDGLGDDLVPDYLVALRDGGFYGWPWVYVSPAFANPHLARRRAPDRVAETISPDVMFQAHSTPLGIAICDRPDWPEHYRSGAFVALRGSWNRRLGTGYGIVFVPFDAEGRAVGTYEDFLLGFLLDPAVPSVWGRPVGVLCAADGSLLFTEESNGRIYRVSTTSDPR
jgi:glucose/arabinose dehydrogenase